MNTTPLLKYFWKMLWGLFKRDNNPGIRDEMKAVATEIYSRNK